VKTFTVGFAEAGYNEAEHAKAVARHLGTEHTELYVSPEEAMAAIPRLPQLYDEPFSDSSQIPTFLIAQLARRHVSVSLSGDAGDESFAGYNRYVWAQGLWSRMRRIPLPLRRALMTSVTAISPPIWDRIAGAVMPLMPKRLRVAAAGDKLHKLCEILDATSAPEIYFRLVSHWKQPASLVIDGMEPATLLAHGAAGSPLGDFTLDMMYWDQLTYLPDDILVKVDRAAMGVSLETRVPFLDHRLIEFAWRLPLALKYRGGEGKWILRRVLDRYVPRPLMARPKMGFGVPIGDWLRGPLRDWAETLLAEERLRRDGFFHVEPIRAKWREHLSGRRQWQYYLWDILMFQAWQASQ
jgi:asparagine synthase (glutamine-hydrolysing)